MWQWAYGAHPEVGDVKLYYGSSGYPLDILTDTGNATLFEDAMARLQVQGSVLRKRLGGERVSGSIGSSLGTRTWLQVKQVNWAYGPACPPLVYLPLRGKKLAG